MPHRQKKDEWNGHLFVKNVIAIVIERGEGGFAFVSTKHTFQSGAFKENCEFGDLNFALI